MKQSHWLQAGVALAMATGAQVAQAHTSGVHGAGFGTGMLHPFIGIDHLLVMLAVGVWAAQLGGRALWRVPLAFVAMMAVGAGMALVGMTLPSVETGIASSVLVLGLLIAFAARFPLGVSMTLVGGFALFHGYAHAIELPQVSSAALYGLGFLLSTALLHAIGAGMGVGFGRSLPQVWGRATGAVIAATGVVFLAFA